MDEEIDVEPTAQTIDAAAKRLREAADDLERTSARMRERKDLTYASEALGTVLNCIQVTRLDLLITRPLRALGK